MTVGELKQILNLFPDDRRVVVREERGENDGYSDFIYGNFDVNSLTEISYCISKSMEGAIRISHSFTTDIDRLTYDLEYYKEQTGKTPMYYIQCNDGAVINTTGKEKK